MCAASSSARQRLRRHESLILDDRQDVDVSCSAGHESERKQRRAADDGKAVVLAMRCKLIGEGVEEILGGPGIINRGVIHLDSRCYISQLASMRQEVLSSLACASGDLVRDRKDPVEAMFAWHRSRLLGRRGIADPLIIAARLLFDHHHQAGGAEFAVGDEHQAGFVLGE